MKVNYAIMMSRILEDKFEIRDADTIENCIIIKLDKQEANLSSFEILNKLWTAGYKIENYKLTEYNDYFKLFIIL